MMLNSSRRCSFQADVLVNSTATNLALKKGDVSASMLAKGDQGLQDECQKKYPRGIKVGEVAETAGHGLGCHVVYHLAMCQWSDPQATQVFDLYSLLYLILLFFLNITFPKGDNLRQSSITQRTNCFLAFCAISNKPC